MADQADHDHRQLVVFTLGAEHYALPIQMVNEIIRYSEPRSVASPNDWVRGVISLRGRIVPVYDVATRLGLRCELTEQSKIVIVEAGAETAGVIVDSVEEVLTVSADQIESAPGADPAMIESIVRIGDRLIVLLTIGAIFAEAAELPAAA
ncbi:MAG TPA: chemotaxis protein CheW [Solirubrobacteraceae bacterium]|nr:chemotaxis protein CheW [Solirubrobacteraceae bacterium]